MERNPLVIKNERNPSVMQKEKVN